ncbi:hypothetical protein T492DRAFT_1149616 [Pavlovales sp. CCMP2436]|nr:hypothetical protein T492DRAFT_1149616 [Pavlovales sp. CCMP2436]
MNYSETLQRFMSLVLSMSTLRNDRRLRSVRNRTIRWTFVVPLAPNNSTPSYHTSFIVPFGTLLGHLISRSSYAKQELTPSEWAKARPTIQQMINFHTSSTAKIHEPTRLPDTTPSVRSAVRSRFRSYRCLGSSPACSARALVGVHGAGIVNALFMRASVDQVVVEIFPSTFGRDHVLNRRWGDQHAFLGQFMDLRRVLGQEVDSACGLNENEIFRRNCDVTVSFDILAPLLLPTRAERPACPTRAERPAYV